MTNRLNKLADELNISFEVADDKIKSQDIKDKVNDILNATPEERRNYMRQRIFKMVVIVATIIALSVTTVLAAQNIDLLKTFFSGDSSSVQDFVKTPAQSVTDGRFKLTLEQVLASKYQILVIYSVEGLTDDAVKELMSDKFVDMDAISFGLEKLNDTKKPNDTKQPNDLEVSTSSFASSELLEQRTATKRYWTIECTDVLNNNEADFFIRLNKMKKPQKIIVPTKCNVETRELTLQGQPYGNAIIKYSPLGVNFEKGIKNGSDESVFDFMDIFFRMKNGEIKTFNELLDYKGCRCVIHGKGDKYQRYEYNALFREVTKISNFKSIIIGNIEYDIENTSHTKPVKINQHLYPFKIKPVYKDVLWLPVYEFSQKIDADYKWDDKSKSAVIKYRGSNYVIIDGSDVVLKDGKEIKLSRRAYILDGNLVAPANIVDKVFHMGLYANSLDKDSNGNRIDIKDWIWTITP